jgi:hypothetical protein
MAENFYHLKFADAAVTNLPFHPIVSLLIFIAACTIQHEPFCILALLFPPFRIQFDAKNFYPRPAGFLLLRHRQEIDFLHKLFFPLGSSPSGKAFIFPPAPLLFLLLKANFSHFVTDEHQFFANLLSYSWLFLLSSLFSGKCSHLPSQGVRKMSRMKVYFVI